MAKSIEDIAQDLDISVTTVRLVLLGKARQYRISEKTEKRVLEYTQLHGAKVNHTARALRLKRTDSLALIVPRLSNPFFAELAERMEIRCREEGLQLSTSCCHDDPNTQRNLIEHFAQRNVDGLFLVPSNPEIVDFASNRFQERLVVLDRDFEIDAIPTVVTENAAASERLANLLCKRDPQETTILFIAGNTGMPSISARLQGFSHALQRLDMSEDQLQLISVAKNQFAEGVRAMQEFLQGGGALPQILLTSSIALLQGALQVLKDTRNGIPKELQLATFDDHSMLDFLPNPIVSVRQDYQMIIDKAFGEMHKLLNNEPAPTHHIIAMQLVIRNQQTE